jgi:membrane protein implicated in regulation of membrane protease activity
MTMGFGAAGAIARHYGMSYLVSSLIGVLCGILLSGVMYLVLAVFYKQQATSLVMTSSAVGCVGKVTTTIEDKGQGEVGIQVDGNYMTYLASSENGAEIPRGQTVRVVRTMGSQLIVEKE